jgi:hypothetical protein
MNDTLFNAAYYCLKHTRQRLIHHGLTTHEVDVVLDMFREEVRRDEQTDDLAGFPSGAA